MQDLNIKVKNLCKFCDKPFLKKSKFNVFCPKCKKAHPDNPFNKLKIPGKKKPNIDL